MNRTPMKRKPAPGSFTTFPQRASLSSSLPGGLTREKGLSSKGEAVTRPQKRGKPISRMSVKMRRRADRYRTLRRAVYVRCDGKCERCGRALDPVVWECHHRLRRSQGGPDTLANCVALCSTCHDYIHHEVDIAKATGWLVKPGVDPSTVRPRPLQASA